MQSRLLVYSFVRFRNSSNKYEMEEAIKGTILDRPTKADSAPICQGALFDLLGYGADTETAVEILEGRFVAPEGTDRYTLLLFKEMDRIWKEMEAGRVDIVVTADGFRYYWKKAKERTSSAHSKLHLGHYKAAAYLNLLLEVHALKLSLITKTGSAFKHWARGVSVMLEKVAGVALVTKLQAILLKEGDFNFHSQLIFGKQMLALTRKNGLVPEEIYSEKERTAEDRVLHQVLA